MSPKLDFPAENCGSYCLCAFVTVLVLPSGTSSVGFIASVMKPTGPSPLSGRYFSIMWVVDGGGGVCLKFKSVWGGSSATNRCQWSLGKKTSRMIFRQFEEIFFLWGWGKSRDKMGRKKESLKTHRFKYLNMIRTRDKVVAISCTICQKQNTGPGTWNKAGQETGSWQWWLLPVWGELTKTKMILLGQPFRDHRDWLLP